MSFKEVTSDGQPKNVYSHPREVSELVYKQLGVYIGFVSFQHNFQGLTDLLINLKLLRTMEDEDKRMGYGMLVNEHTKQPIKTRLDRDSLERLEQVWERGGYLLTRYEKVSEDVTDIKEEFYLYEYPEDLSDNEEIQRMPALFSMKSKDEVSSENVLMRINEAVPEREAYRFQEPRSFCENAKLEYEENGVMIPFFKSVSDIENSPYWTMHVPRLYHDIMTSIAWRESLKWIGRLHVNLWRVGKDLEAIEFNNPSKNANVRKKIEGA